MHSRADFRVPRTNKHNNDHDKITVVRRLIYIPPYCTNEKRKTRHTVTAADYKLSGALKWNVRKTRYNESINGLQKDKDEEVINSTFAFEYIFIIILS